MPGPAQPPPCKPSPAPWGANNRLRAFAGSCTWHHPARAPQHGGHSPARSCLHAAACCEASNSSCPEKKTQFQAKEGKGEQRNPAGLAAAPWGPGHLLLSIAGTAYPSPVPRVPHIPRVPRPLPASLARQRGGRAPPHKGAGPEQWSRPALPRHAASPAFASAGIRGTASGHRGVRPGRESGWRHRRPLCQCRVPARGHETPTAPPNIMFPFS